MTSLVYTYNDDVTIDRDTVIPTVAVISNAALNILICMW